jgi:hypothetical protein
VANAENLRDNLTDYKCRDATVSGSYVFSYSEPDIFTANVKACTRELADPSKVATRKGGVKA